MKKKIVVFITLLSAVMLLAACDTRLAYYSEEDKYTSEDGLIDPKGQANNVSKYADEGTSLAQSPDLPSKIAIITFEWHTASTSS